jgi:hypothetical protein
LLVHSLLAMSVVAHFDFFCSDDFGSRPDLFSHSLFFIPFYLTQLTLFTHLLLKKTEVLISTTLLLLSACLQVLLLTLPIS